MNSSMKKNIKLYPFYKMISWDLLFYYAISLLFLTSEKKLTASEVLFADSFYLLFKAVFQIPSILLIDKFGKRNSLIFANSCIAIYALLVIGCTGLPVYIIADIILSLGYVIKTNCESNILYDSIPNTENRRKIFAKLDGRGTAFYYVLDSITSIASGFLYLISPYIPMIICLVFALLSTIMSYMFVDTKQITEDKENDKITVKKYFKDLLSAFKYILNSRRLRGLILFNAVLAGIFPLLATYRRSLLNDINVPSEFLGIIFAVLGIIAGISSKKAVKFHKKWRNRTLSILGLPSTLSAILFGLVVILDLPYPLMLIIILASFTVQYITKGPYYTLITQYLSSFATSDMRVKISSANSLIEGLVGGLLSLLGSFFLDITTTAYASILIGCICTLSLIAILEYMKKYVGLKPEQYSKRDINYIEMK